MKQQRCGFRIFHVILPGVRGANYMMDRIGIITPELLSSVIRVSCRRLQLSESQIN